MTVSIVTGAGSGIGRATASALAARGDDIVCADLDGDSAATVAAALPSAVARKVDVAAREECDALVSSTVDAFGRVDVLVAAAGIERSAPADDLDDDAWLTTLAVNLSGVFWCARAAGRAMLAGDGGRMVLIGSINSQMALGGQAAYCASKGGVLMLARALAVDWGSRGVAVNVVGPGVVDTPMSARSLADPDRRAALMGRTPLNRPASAEEIASVIEFLTSPRASYVNGAYVPVDGGWLAG
jgi:NAD(P)-dependent dehydrogenase (short-subunit alcohol dehydrogenase family)